MWKNSVVCCTGMHEITAYTFIANMKGIMRFMRIQWSLQFKTTPFNNSLYFKTTYQ